MTYPPNYDNPQLVENRELRNVVNQWNAGLRDRIAEQAPWFNLAGVKLGGVNDSGRPNWASWATPLTEEERNAAEDSGVNLREVRNKWFGFQAWDEINKPEVAQSRIQARMQLGVSRDRRADAAWQMSSQNQFAQRDREDKQKFESMMLDKQSQANMRQTALNSVLQRQYRVLI